MPKKSTSFRLSDEALALIRELSSKFSISQTSVIEVAVRKMAKDERRKG
jgi:hypothetical protein